MTTIENVLKSIKENKKIDNIIDSYLNEKHSKFYNSKASEYTKKRGITNNDILDFFSFGNDDNTNKLIISYGLGSHYFTQRNLYKSENEPKYVKLPKLTQPIFNEKAIIESNFIFITEGELNSISILQALTEKGNNFSNGIVFTGEGIAITSIAIGGVGGVKKLIEYIVKNRIENKIFLISFDNDEPGRKGSENLKKELEKVITESKLNIFFRKALWNNDELNDTNELLLQDNDFYNNILKNLSSQNLRTEYSSLAKFEIFTEQVKNKNFKIYKTQFNRLNNILNGGLTDGLYILGALSSFGKTTFLLNLTRHLASQGEDVLFFSTETPTFELMGKIQSHLSYFCYENEELKAINENEELQPIKFLSYADIKNQNNLDYKYNSLDYENKKELLKMTEEEYKKIATNIFIYESIGTLLASEVKRIAREHIWSYGKLPIIIIDYLQAMGSNNPNDTDKRKTDLNVLELKQLAREERLCILATSSFNRDSYSKDPSMASFKESGAIEYGADVLLTLHPNEREYKENKQKKSINENEVNEMINTCKSKLKRSVLLSVLKNRNGRTNIGINFNYYSLVNTFIEL